MTLQSSGAISLANVQTEFGGSNPIGINEYYGVASGVPASGTISLANFYGKSAGGGAPAFPGWINNPRTLGTSNVVDPVNTTNSFTGNTVTPGQQSNFTLYLGTGTPGAGSATLRFYLAGSLNTTWSGTNSGVNFTPNIGSSSIRFDSTLTDTDPYYGGGGGHYTPYVLIYAIYASTGIYGGQDVYLHEFEYANIGDADYDD